MNIRSSEEIDEYEVFAEMGKDEDNQAYTQNPLMIGFVNEIMSDKVAGVVHSFKSALKQLPKDGPGCVWIRITDNAWQKGMANSFAQAEKLLTSELSGGQNRRVNVIYVTTRIFERLSEGENRGLGYEPLVLTIEHKNPIKLWPSRLKKS